MTNQIWTVAIFHGGILFMFVVSLFGFLVNLFGHDLVMDDHHGRTKLDLDPIKSFNFLIIHFSLIILLLFNVVLLSTSIKGVAIKCPRKT